MNTNDPDAWSPDKYVKIFQSTLEAYEKEHPHWQIEVLVSLIGRGLLGLKQHLEAGNKTGITWEHPFVELHCRGSSARISAVRRGIFVETRTERILSLVEAAYSEMNIPNMPLRWS